MAPKAKPKAEEPLSPKAAKSKVEARPPSASRGRETPAKAASKERKAEATSPSRGQSSPNRRENAEPSMTAPGAPALDPSPANAAPVKPVKNREKKSAGAVAAEKEALGNVWSHISKGKTELRANDIEALVKNANTNEIGPGARVDADALREFTTTEFGATSNITEALFMDKATAYFNDCEPSEECTEIWQMIGGSLTGEGTIEAGDLCDALERLNCDVTKEEIDDLVAFASKGNSKMTYEDFVQVLFP